MLCRLPSWENSCLIFPASFHRDTAITMEGIVTMYQDFMKKAGQCLALPSYQTGSTTCFIYCQRHWGWPVIPEASLGQTASCLCPYTDATLGFLCCLRLLCINACVNCFGALVFPWADDLQAALQYGFRLYCAESG